GSRPSLTEMSTDFLKRFIEAITFKRNAYVWMAFESSATGDAFVLVAVTSALRTAAFFGLSASLLVRLLISTLFSWLILSGIVYLLGKHVFEGWGRYESVLRVVGFAHPTLLVSLALLPLLRPWLALLIGSVWFLAVVAAGVKEVLELSTDRAVAASILGWVAFQIVDALLRI
ncbi:MAG: YIP1 family protein, partial [Acidimicrobiia bacterium]